MKIKNKKIIYIQFFLNYFNNLKWITNTTKWQYLFKTSQYDIAELEKLYMQEVK